MYLLKNLGVKIKLITSFVIVALLIGIVGGVGINSLKSVNKKAQEISDKNRVIFVYKDIQQKLTQINSDLFQLIYSKDLNQKDLLIKDMTDCSNKNNEYFTEIQNYEMNDEIKEIFNELGKSVKSYKEIRESVIKAIDEDHIEEAAKRYNEIPKVRDEMFANLNKIIGIYGKDIVLQNNNIDLIYMSSNTIMIGISIFGLILAVIIGLMLARDIHIPLKKMKVFCESLANYDLSYEFNITRLDEFGKTATSLNRARDNIKALIETIIGNTQSISASSEELSATVQELSSKAISIDEAVNNIAEGLQEASAGTEEISASIQEVDSSINILSEKASYGSRNANDAKQRAVDVRTNSQKAVAAAKDIYFEKKKKMEKVIEDGKVVGNIKVMADTIAELSEQINLLALNAAIEAARAGEQGKGFAVVADEVKNLAEDSSEAVKNIQDTIVEVQEAFKNSIDTGKDILEFINNDVNYQFNEFEKTGKQYYDDSEFVSKMSEEIAAMSEEVTSTAGQVSKAAQNMAGTAQKSSEQVEKIKESVNNTTNALEQVALTAQEQAEIAQKLSEVVQKFKI